jgi:hypothetical protein
MSRVTLFFVRHCLYFSVGLSRLKNRTGTCDEQQTCLLALRRNPKVFTGGLTLENWIDKVKQRKLYLHLYGEHNSRDQTVVFCFRGVFVSLQAPLV